jgi:uncharacterized tellurite resistance protein B-like protein
MAPGPGLRKPPGVSLLRFLGFADAGSPRAGVGEAESLRAIAAELEGLPSAQARHLAAFAYVLARVAHVDLEIDDAEAAEMRRIVGRLGGLDEGEARVVVEIARHEARRLGGTQNYLVTREFRAHSTPQQRLELLECLFAVAAADGSISATESDETLAIAEELGFTRAEALGVRSRFREHLAALRALPGER